MKKFFTLIAMALMAVSANAQAETDIALDAAAWGWGWNSSVAVDEGVMTVTLTGDYGAAGTGWDPVQDWSGYAKICVVFESYTGGWGQLVLKFSDDTEIMQSFGEMTSQKTITLDFEGNAKATGVRQFSIQGGTSNPVIKVSRVYLVEKLEYQEPVSVNFDAESGFIPAENLTSFTDAAKVEFTVNATGETLSKYYGWGIGKIESANAAIDALDYALKNEGDNVYVTTIKELRPALEADAPENGVKGLNWVMWGQGGSEGNVFVRKSITVYEVKGASTAISAVKTVNTQNAVRYNLAGQKVDAAYKGVVIENGKKFVVK